MLHSKIIRHEKLVGANFIQTKKTNYLIGSRTGIHQDLMMMSNFATLRDKLPDVVLLSDLTIKDRVSCLDLEFVFLASLFLGMDFENEQPTSRLFDFKNRKVTNKLKVVIEEGFDDIVWGQLGPSLLGSTRGFLKNTCRLNKELWQMLVQEADFFNLKDADGNTLKIEDLVEILYWNDKGEIEFEDGLVVKKGEKPGDFDLYNVATDEFIKTNVDFEADAVKPVWKIPQSLQPFSYSDISITPLGTSSPFSTDAPPTSYWLKLGQKENYLIDCGFFTDVVFEANGGNLNDLRGIILTHCHGDHFNPIPYLYRAKPIEIWTTFENYKLAQKITCAKANISPEEFRRRFIFKEVKAMYPGYSPERYMFGMLEIEFHYSIHPIPTIGLTIYKGDHKLMVFSSDMVDLRFIKEKLFETGVISKDRYEMIIERFDQKSHPNTLFLLDCGGDGFIHGKTVGYTEFFHDTTKVVECHRGARKEGEGVTTRLAEPLALIEILSYSIDARITAMVSQMLYDLGLGFVVDTAIRLREELEIVELAAGQPVVLAGKQTSSSIYLIDYGNCRSSAGLVYKSGQWFGEETLFNEEVYRSSIHTVSPVRLIKLSAPVMKSIFEDSEKKGIVLLENMTKLFKLRSALSAAKIFADLDLPADTFDNAALEISTENFLPGEYIYTKGQVDDGHMHIINSGTVLVELGKDTSVCLSAHDIIGEGVASGANAVRNAGVRAASQVQLLRVPREVFASLMDNPKIHMRVTALNKKRSLTKSYDKL